jgi:pimeloyl-ACP methyl ester carboxylesterase
MFDSHLNALRIELELRDSIYLSEHGCHVLMPGDELLDCNIANFSNSAQATDKYIRGIEKLRGSGIHISHGKSDKIGQLISAGILDAIQSEYEKISPYSDFPPIHNPSNVFNSICDEYFDLHRLKDGRRVYIAKSGKRPMVLIGALGVPAFFWTQLLISPDPEWRPVIIESQCGSLEEGGMSTSQSLTNYASDFDEIIRQLRIGPIILAAWCNGGRIAISLARQSPDLVDSLILIATTFRGALDLDPYPSPFEDSLDLLFHDVLRKPGMAGFVTRVLRDIIVNPKIDVSDISIGSRLFLGSVRKDSALALFAPMSTSSYLLNYARRTESDEAYDIISDLLALSIPMLVVTGDCDNVISTDLTADVMHRVKHARHVEIQGAGHYLHDLQYRYFRDITARFLADPYGDLVSSSRRLRDLIPVD